jgi:hypothetical protein
MPKYFISSGCSFSDTISTPHNMWNDFVAEYLDCELISKGVGGCGNQFIAHSFINEMKQKLDSGIDGKDLFGIVQWSMIHRYAFLSSDELVADSPNIFYGDRVINPRTFTDYDALAKESNGWVSIAPWHTDQPVSYECPDLYHLSTQYYVNLQHEYTDVLNTLTLYNLVKSFCEKYNIKVMFVWINEKHRQKVLNPEQEWMYTHLTNEIKDSIDLPGIQQEVIKYEESNSDVWSEDDYRGHPNENGYRMYFEEHIKPRLKDV